MAERELACRRGREDTTIEKHDRNDQRAAETISNRSQPKSNFQIRQTRFRNFRKFPNSLETFEIRGIDSIL